MQKPVAEVVMSPSVVQTSTPPAKVEPREPFVLKDTTAITTRSLSSSEGGIAVDQRFVESPKRVTSAPELKIDDYSGNKNSVSTEKKGAVTPLIALPGSHPATRVTPSIPTIIVEEDQPQRIAIVEEIVDGTTSEQHVQEDKKEEKHSPIVITSAAPQICVSFEIEEIKKPLVSVQVEEFVEETVVVRPKVSVVVEESADDEELPQKTTIIEEEYVDDEEYEEIYEEEPVVGQGGTIGLFGAPDNSRLRTPTIIQSRTRKNSSAASFFKAFESAPTEQEKEIVYTLGKAGVFKTGPGSAEVPKPKPNTTPTVAKKQSWMGATTPSAASAVKRPSSGSFGSSAAKVSKREYNRSILPEAVALIFPYTRSHLLLHLVLPLKKYQPLMKVTLFFTVKNGSLLLLTIFCLTQVMPG